MRGPERFEALRRDRDWLGVASNWGPGSFRTDRMLRGENLGREVCRYEAREWEKPVRDACRNLCTRRRTTLRQRRCRAEFPNRNRARGFPSFVSWHPPPYARGPWDVMVDPMRYFRALDRGFSRHAQRGKCRW